MRDAPGAVQEVLENGLKDAEERAAEYLPDELVGRITLVNPYDLSYDLSLRKYLTLGT